MKYKRKTKSNWHLLESIKVLWSMDPGWKKWRPDIGIYLIICSNLLKIISESEQKLCDQIVTDRNQYRKLLQNMIVEGLIKMLEPVVNIKYDCIFMVGASREIGNMLKVSLKVLKHSTKI